MTRGHCEKQQTIPYNTHHNFAFLFAKPNVANFALLLLNLLQLRLVWARDPSLPQPSTGLRTHGGRGSFRCR